MLEQKRREKEAYEMLEEKKKGLGKEIPGQQGSGKPGSGTRAMQEVRLGNQARG